MTDLVKSLKIGNNSYSIKDDKAVPLITKNEEAVLSFTGMYRGTPVTDTNTYLTKEGVIVEKGANPVWANMPVEYNMYESIVANADICVMTIYRSNVFMYSTDKGKTWTDTQVPVSGTYEAICYGNGKFVALPYSTDASYALYSTDGISWTQVTTPAARNWSSVCYGGGKYVAVSGNSSDFLYSTNGIDWTSSTLPSEMTGVNRVVYGGGKFVVIGELLNKAAYSTDGINWTVTNLPSQAYWRSLAFCNGKFVAAVYNSSLSESVLAQSDDGITWTSLQLDLGGECTVASSPMGFIFIDPSKTLFSSDLVSFIEVKGQATVEAMPNFASSSDALFLQYGNYSAAISMLPVEVMSISSTVPSWAQTIAYGNGVFVATPVNNDKGVYSYDGINWTEMTMPSSGRWSTCVYGNGTFVSTQNDTGRDVAAYSTDGINWQASTLPSTRYWNRLMFTNNKFVAADYSSQYVAYSTDGISWQSSTHPTIGSINDTACSNDKFVLLSSSSVAYSTDGINWQSTSLPSEHKWYYVTYGNGKFVAIDYNVSTGSTAAVYSTDGSTWQSSTLPMSAAWNKPVYGNGVFVVTGFTLSSPATYVCAYSTDGITWNLAQLPFTTSVGQAAFGDGFFVALANNNNSLSDITLGAYSKDGATWVPFEAPSHMSYTAITSVSDKFVAAARDRGEGMNWTYHLFTFKIGLLPYSKSLSYTAAEVDTALAAKQGTLTAGTGISISDSNVISATSGSSYTAGKNIQISDENVISATSTYITNTDAIVGTGAPTTDIEASLGQLYIDSSTGDAYVCSAVNEVENFIIRGTPTISEDKVASGFSSSNYIDLPLDHVSSIQTMILESHYRTGSSFDPNEEYPYAFGFAARPNIKITPNYLSVTWQYPEGSWHSSSNMVRINANTEYWIRTICTTNTTTIYHSVDGETWTQVGSLSYGPNPMDVYFILGKGWWDEGAPFKGDIYLADTKLVINGVEQKLYTTMAKSWEKIIINGTSYIDDTSTALYKTWSANKLNTIIGNLETLINEL